MNALLRLNVRTRLVLMLLAVQAGLVVVTGFLLYSKYESTLAEKRLAVQHVVDSALGIVKFYEAEAAAGRLTVDEAKARAANSIRQMRYNGSEYLWINDLDAKMLMHPTKPDLEGKDVSGLKDANGNPFLLNMIAATKKDGAGFVDYDWPKPGASQPVPKVSRVQAFVPWGWMLGSGIYVDDVRNAFLRDLWLSLAAVAAIMLGLTSVMLVIARSLTKQIGTEPARAVETVNRIAAGDYSADIAPRSERAELGVAMQAMTAALRAAPE